MDRYDRIIRDILQKTDDEDILWKVGAAGPYSDVLLNPHRVIRKFTADYLVSNNNYNLFFVEKKVDAYDDMVDVTSETREFELLIVDGDGQLILHLYDGVVDRDDLFRLSGLIEARNDRARKFFEAFDQSGAA